MSETAGAQVEIGVGSDAIAGIHAANTLALPYVTYYVSAVPGTFISSTADAPEVGFYADGRLLQSSLHAGWDVLCPDSVTFRQRVATQLSDLLNSGYDGLFIDNSINPPAASSTCTAPHPHVSPGQRGDDAYLALLAEVRAALLQRSPNAMMITNPFSPAWADQLGTGSQPSLWQLSDFVLWESYGYTTESGSTHENWPEILNRSYKYAADPVKSAKIIALSYPQNLTEALFSFAIARMFGFRWTANLGVNGSSGHFGAFTPAMPFIVGEPQGLLFDNQGVLARQFSNGIAYANTGTSPIAITVPQPGKLVTAGGTQPLAASTNINLPPKNAAVLLFQ